VVPPETNWSWVLAAVLRS